MQYFNLQKFAKAFKVRKIRNIFAVTYKQAKDCNIIDKNDKINMNDQDITLKGNMMLCKDEDNNMWFEKVSNFEDRYKRIEQDNQDCWTEYKPTKNAINLAEEQDDGTYLMREKNNRNKKWEVTPKEYKKYYKEAQSEDIVYTINHVDHYKGQDEYFLQALLRNSEKCIGSMTCVLVGNIFYVYDIKVHKDYRRLGVGKNLIIKMLEEKPCAKVIPINVTTEGKPFWRHLHRSKHIR